MKSSFERWIADVPDVDASRCLRTRQGRRCAGSRFVVAAWNQAAGIDLVALDGDETAAFIRARSRDLDRSPGA